MPPQAPFYASAEEWIKAEWSWLHANIALHPYLWVGISFGVGNLLGVLLHI